MSVDQIEWPEPWASWWEMVSDIGYPKKDYRDLGIDDERSIAYWEREGIAWTEIARAWGTPVGRVRKIRNKYLGHPIPL